MVYLKTVNQSLYVSLFRITDDGPSAMECFS